jgi:hypothetical protein
MEASKSKNLLFAGLSWGLKPGKAWLQTMSPQRKTLCRGHACVHGGALPFLLTEPAKSNLLLFAAPASKIPMFHA